MTEVNHKYKRLWHDIIISAISFIFLTVGGSTISYIWQNKANKNQIALEQNRYEKELATKLFEEMSKQLDKQVSNFQLILKDSDFKKKCMDDYLVWDENKTRYLAMTEKYFGNVASQSIYNFKIEFRSLFEQLILSDNLYDISIIGTKVNKLEMDIVDFNRQMIEDLLKEEIGSSRK